MPIYDYTCSNCGQRTEVIHGINDSGPRFCPNCGAEGTLRKAFSTPAILFKGSGWAKKDRAATRTPASSGSSDKSDKDKGSDKGSEKGRDGVKSAGASTGDAKSTSSNSSSSSSPSSSTGTD
jgi:putative FmdB family regulatory protein